MDSLRSHKSGLPPVVGKNTEILILGTLPSDMSLAAEQYYANPGNDLWRLVGAALDKRLVVHHLRAHDSSPHTSMTRR